MTTSRYGHALYRLLGPQYFHGRLSAAGKGYDPTSTGGTNLAPTLRKLIDATKAALVDRHVHGRTLGFLGEPRIDVLELNLNLDDAQKNS